MSLVDRIREALSDRTLTKIELAEVVFADNPKAFNRPRQGGSYGCILPLSKALKSMGSEIREDTSYGLGHKGLRTYLRLVK